MKQIPKFQATLIARPKAIEDKPHPSIAKNAQAADKHEQDLARLREICQALQGVAPKDWGDLKEVLSSIYLTGKLADRRNPMDFLGQGIPPEYWGITKAYFSGQIEVLEAIFSTIEMPPAEVKVKPVEVPVKSFLQKVLDLFR